jgi:molybdate transport system substrate-binding protein
MDARIIASRLEAGGWRLAAGILVGVLSALLAACGGASSDHPAGAAATADSAAAGGAVPGTGGPVLVFAAASLKTTLDRVAPAIERQAGTVLRVSYTGSSALARQIEAGAPAGVFISADEAWMDYLEERALIEPGTRVRLLGNRLVLVSPAARPVRLRLEPGIDLRPALGDGRLAVADPATVPAGRYARAALEALGVWPEVATRLAPADNVRAALLLVARGEAPLGVVYATDARAEPGVAVVDTFGADTHPPIVYPAALVAPASTPARRVLEALASAPVRDEFLRDGFTPPDEG